MLPLENTQGLNLCAADGPPVDLARPTRSLYVEGDVVRPGGSRLTLGVTYTPLFDGEGRLRNIIVNVVDITRFREAEQMKSTFVSVISHELKTPVSLIKGYASTLAPARRVVETGDGARRPGRDRGGSRPAQRADRQPAGRQPHPGRRVPAGPERGQTSSGWRGEAVDGFRLQTERAPVHAGLSRRRCRLSWPTRRASAR